MIKYTQIVQCDAKLACTSLQSFDFNIEYSDNKKPKPCKFVDLDRILKFTSYAA